jgi:hypothetical protein
MLYIIQAAIRGFQDSRTQRCLELRLVDEEVRCKSEFPYPAVESFNLNFDADSSFQAIFPTVASLYRPTGPWRQSARQANAFVSLFTDRAARIPVALHQLCRLSVLSTARLMIEKGILLRPTYPLTPIPLGL